MVKIVQVARRFFLALLLCANTFSNTTTMPHKPMWIHLSLIHVVRRVTFAIDVLVDWVRCKNTTPLYIIWKVRCCVAMRGVTCISLRKRLWVGIRINVLLIRGVDTKRMKVIKISLWRPRNIPSAVRCIWCIAARLRSALQSNLGMFLKMVWLVLFSLCGYVY